jgi:hypothetical protein
MKQIQPCFRIDRRVLLSTFVALPALPALFTTGAQAQAQASPLGSWNNGPAKQAVLGFGKRIFAFEH